MPNERIEQVIAAAGIPCRLIRWTKPPTAAVYAEYTDSEITDGADGPAGINALSEHTVDISVYEAVIGTKKAQLEAALDNAGLRWSRGQTYWLENAERYETDYTVTYVCKRVGAQP